ncbi:uncharacterized protein K02A2.6-like [Ipomoea triloba]|uniref:uncharacterized protein K02A2.6-like n=1 Tax=Ipomoea triloba TaxID=35885 RepID=UPI00125CEBA9|nr:uncharacterized protein K02A2.6-like [Ipomoea triloba]
MDYVSKWVEAEALQNNDARSVTRFLKKLFTRFGVPRIVISDRGTHFRNVPMWRLLQKQGIQHRGGIPYHPQTTGKLRMQIEISRPYWKRQWRGIGGIVLTSLTMHCGPFGLLIRHR